MSIFSRLSVLAVVAVSVLAALVHGQANTPNTCTASSPQCSEVQMTMAPGSSTTSSGSIFIGLVYDTLGNICSITTGSIGAQGGLSAQILSVTQGLGATNKLSVQPGALAPEEIININLGFTAQYVSATLGVVQATGTLIGNVATGGAILTFRPFFTAGQTTAAATFDSCSGGAVGDPLFSGFLGQQFYVEGKDNQVINMLNTFNMQLNGRFVTLEEGAALYPHQQEKIQLESTIAHQAEPAVAAFPVTTAWNHPGTYFGEIGVALLDENRVHAKAGSYATGFAKVTLNGRNLPVSDDFVVLGSGSNTTFVQRVSAHELTVRTANVEFTVVNSDNFLNVEHLHLERGSKKFNHFSGLLGATTKFDWQFDTKAVEEAFVESNNLFERETVEA